MAASRLSARGDGEPRVLALRGPTGALVKAAFTGDCCAAGAAARRRARCGRCAIDPSHACGRGALGKVGVPL